MTDQFGLEDGDTLPCPHCQLLLAYDASLGGWVHTDERALDGRPVAPMMGACR